MSHRAFGEVTRNQISNGSEHVEEGERTVTENIHTIFCVITLHIPDPPPVQNKTLPLKRSGWNTAVDKAATGGGACTVLGCGMLDMIVPARVRFGGHR
jgi:hypothetical protein